MTIKDKSQKGLIAALLGLALALPAVGAQAQESPSPRTLVVSGQGEVRAVPDTAMISAGVTTQGETAAAALSENTRRMNAVFAALRRMGIPDRSIQTSNFSVQPQYPQFNPNGAQEPRRIIGYEVSNQVNVNLEDIAKLGQVLDLLVSSGANNLSGINFSVREPSALLDAARKDAVSDATEKAKVYAEAAGVMLGPILSITESGGIQARPLAMPLFRAAESVPIATGETTISATVNITWEIQ